MTIKLKASGRWAKPRPGPRRGRGRNDWTLWCSWVNVIANKLHKAHISWTGSTMGQRPGHRKDSINAQTKGQQTEGRTGSLRDAQTQRHINNSIVNTLGTATCDNITTPNGRKTFLLTKINFFLCHWCCHVTTLSIYTKWGSLLVEGGMCDQCGESEEQVWDL